MSHLDTWQEIQRRFWILLDQAAAASGRLTSEIRNPNQHKEKAVAAARMRVIVSLHKEVWYRTTDRRREYRVTNNNPGPKWRPISSGDIASFFVACNSATIRRTLDRAKAFRWERPLANGSILWCPTRRFTNEMHNEEDDQKDKREEDSNQA